MNAGSIQTSARLQATLRVLDDGEEHSTKAIGVRTGSVAVHSDITALRVNGLNIVRRQVGTMHLYRLIPNSREPGPAPHRPGAFPSSAEVPAPAFAVPQDSRRPPCLRVSVVDFVQRSFA